MTEPSATTFQGTSGPWSAYAYTKDTTQTTTTAVFYEIDSSAGFSGANGLEFRFVNSATEIHAGTDNNTVPVVISTTLTGTRTSSLVVVSGTEVHVWNNTTATSPKMTFTVSSNMLWSSSGGGTGTSGGVGFTGSFYGLTSSSFSYEVTHTSAFTSPQTYELHSTTLTPTFISDLVVGAASGSTNSRSHTWGIPDVIQIRDAYGTIAAELTLSHSASGPKKVFSNFW